MHPTVCMAAAFSHGLPAQGRPGSCSSPVALTHYPHPREGYTLGTLGRQQECLVLAGRAVCCASKTGPQS